MTRINKTEEQWAKELTTKQYEVLRRHSTEQAFTGKYYLNKDTGTYSCVACQNPLFSSNDKFDSGSGWPSFVKPIEGSVEMTTDTNYGMTRTEVHCARCGGHLGHVFDDGPKEQGGQRYCINSVSLSMEKDETK